MIAKSKAYHRKKQLSRAQHKAEKRRDVRKTQQPKVHRQPILYLGNRRPAIAPKSNELALFRLEHHKDENKRILPRPERGCKVLALNGRFIDSGVAA